MVELDWKHFKRGLQIPKLLKSGIPEVLIQENERGLKISSYEKRRMVEVVIPSTSVNLPHGVQYSISFDHPLFNESDVESWSIEPKKDILKFIFKNNGSTKVTDIRKKAKPVDVTIPTDWVEVASVNKACLLRSMDHLEASANVKDTKSEEDARINAVFFRKDLSFSINRHTASVTDGLASVDFSIPSLDFAVIRGFVERLDHNGDVSISKSKNYMRVGQGDIFLYTTLINSREPNFSRLNDKYLFNFETKTSDLKALVKWSEYNAEASSYLTLEFKGASCEFKTKFKSLGEISGINKSSPFTVNLPSKGFVGLMDYLEGDIVNLRYSHEAMSTIFNLNVSDSSGVSSYDHFIQTVKF